MTLTEARQAIADALSTVEGIDARPRPISQPRTGDGWVVISRLAPGDFTSSRATFTAVVILGADAARAEALLEAHGVALIDAVTSSDLHPADVSLEPELLVVGSNASQLYALALTLTLEVD